MFLLFLVHDLWKTGYPSATYLYFCSHKSTTLVSGCLARQIHRECGSHRLSGGWIHLRSTCTETKPLINKLRDGLFDFVHHELVHLVSCGTTKSFYSSHFCRQMEERNRQLFPSNWKLLCEKGTRQRRTCNFWRAQHIKYLEVSRTPHAPVCNDIAERYRSRCSWNGRCPHPV